MKKFILIFFFIYSTDTFSKNVTPTIKGQVKSNDGPVAYANLIIKGSDKGVAADEHGHFELKDLQPGKLTLRIMAIGFLTQEKVVEVHAGEILKVNINMVEDVMGLEEVVISGTRTSKRRTETAVPVNILDSKAFQITQSNTLSEGLCFQPGLRMEVDCQTCNYSQLRMNGMGGSYTQILINSRPIFSALNGLYGLEQIPGNMIERVEVVRGGGSAMYGSSAIAGTVNIITKDPKENRYELNINNSIIDQQAFDNMINGNVSVINQKLNSGATFFVSRRFRQDYDANDDGFSEIPRIMNNTFGMNTFFDLTSRSKLRFNFQSINEERDGGDRLDEPPHLREQSEWRGSNILAGGIDYDLQIGKNKNLSVFVAAQDTKRKHYTGTPGLAIYDTIAYPQGYGNTKNNTFMGGFQFNYEIPQFLGGKNTLTTGLEYQDEYVLDEIPAYDFLIDQQTKQLGVFLQSDWDVTEKFTALLGARFNKHNFVDHVVINPRVSLLYKLTPNLQARASYANGFRAPQAFDTDMHIAFAGGGISQIQLDPNLKPEYSNSFSGSIDFDNPQMEYIWGFSVSGFYTTLNDAFVLEEIGTDEKGNMMLQKLNGGKSTVSGVTLEVRANINRLLEWDAGVTIQRSVYDRIIEWSAEVAGTNKFLRTPNHYGFYTFTFTPKSKWNLSLSGVYTGSMFVPHFAGAAGVDADELVYTEPFFENNIKGTYKLKIEKIQQDIEIFAGVQNIFNAYQSDFDTGNNRDSNYVYGPARPRTIFLGIRLGKL